MAWTWAAATCRGTSHERAGTPCQDVSRALLMGRRKSVFAAVVSDGAGSAHFGGQGAAVTCRTIVSSARRHFAKSSVAPTDEALWFWIDEARDRINTAAARRDTNARQFACTLVAVFAMRDSTLILHVGDGAAVLRQGRDWVSPSWPANGEYASTTFFVTEEPMPQLRITRLDQPADAVAVFTDGIERLTLNFAEERPHAPFFDAMFQPILRSEAAGKSSALTASLTRYLNGSAVNERTDDDKTLILAVRR
jgi:hypothetical protein